MTPHENENTNPLTLTLFHQGRGKWEEVKTDWESGRAGEQFPSSGGVSRSDGVGVVYSVILSGAFPRENLIFKKTKDETLTASEYEASG